MTKQDKQTDDLLDALKKMVKKYGQNQSCPVVELARSVIREVEDERGH